ncbi:MAG: YkgJ family cysteine cluster protein [Candidatus Hodarchaeales archaeon]|jgi:Fe-S-cluster containining protein
MPKKVITGSVCQKNNCHHCCIETEMLLLKTDSTRISHSTGFSIPDFSFLTDDNQRMLRNKLSKENKICFFLDSKGNCSIYDIRPEGCSYYPIIWDLTNHQAVSDDYCPHYKQFIDKIEYIGSDLELFVLKLYGYL